MSIVSSTVGGSTITVWNRRSSAPSFSMYLRYSFSVEAPTRSEEHTSELQSRLHLVCRLLLEKKKKHYSRDDASGDLDAIAHRPLLEQDSVRYTQYTTVR